MTKILKQIDYFERQNVWKAKYFVSDAHEPEMRRLFPY